MKKLTLFLIPLFVLLTTCQKEGPIYNKATGIYIVKINNSTTSSVGKVIKQ